LTKFNVRRGSPKAWTRTGIRNQIRFNQTRIAIPSRIVDSYKDLNTAKFAVIHELEEQLPVALFRHEWFVCGHNRKKKDKPVEDQYVPLTHLERWVPVAFAVLYIGLGAYAILVPGTGKGTQQTQPAAQHQTSAEHPATESH
jgi:hypothetical protein